MKWIETQPGTERIITKFLLWPIKIGPITRWLETATWKEIYMAGLGWHPYKWLN